MTAKFNTKPLKQPNIGRSGSRTIYTTAGHVDGSCRHAHTEVETATACLERYARSKERTDRKVFRLVLPTTPRGRRWWKDADVAALIFAGVRVNPPLSRPAAPVPKPSTVVLHRLPGFPWRLVARRDSTGLALLEFQTLANGEWGEGVRPNATAMRETLFSIYSERIALI